MKRNKLFPVYCDGKAYYEKDCDDVYLAFYHDRMALGYNDSVYVSEGMWVSPDGTVFEW